MIIILYKKYFWYYNAISKLGTFRKIRREKGDDDLQKSGKVQIKTRHVLDAARCWPMVKAD